MAGIIKETKLMPQLVLERMPSGELVPTIDGVPVEGFLGSTYQNVAGQSTSLTLYFDPSHVTFATHVPKNEIN